MGKQRPKTWTIVTYDLLRNDRVFGWLQHQSWRSLIADESQQVRRIKATRTRRLINLSKSIPERMVMTGTPIGNHYEDIFSQMLIADGGASLGENYYKFLHRFFWPEPSGWKWHIFTRGKRAIIKAISNTALFIESKDAMPLPRRRWLTRSTPLYKKQRKLYQQVMMDWELTLGEKTINLDYVITQMQKCQQLASGFAYNEKHEAVWIPSSKLDLLCKMLKDPDDLFYGRKKIVIWCAFTAEIEAIASRIRYESELGSSVVYHGQMSPKQKIAARQAFCYNPDVQFFIAQVESGVGMNELVVADTAFYISNSRKWLARQQSERRTWRRGSERHEYILYVDLISEGTLDGYIRRQLHKHRDAAASLLRDLRTGNCLSDAAS